MIISNESEIGDLTSRECFDDRGAIVRIEVINHDHIWTDSTRGRIEDLWLSIHHRRITNLHAWEVCRSPQQGQSHYELQQAFQPRR